MNEGYRERLARQDGRDHMVNKMAVPSLGVLQAAARKNSETGRTQKDPPKYSRVNTHK